MANSSDQLGIYVDIGKNSVPRLNFSIGEHTTNVDIDALGAANLGGSLLTACFLSSLDQTVPPGTIVAPGQLPVASVEGALDPATNLPTLRVSLIGGGTLDLVFSADVAAIATTLLLQQVRAVTPMEADQTFEEKSSR